MSLPVVLTDEAQAEFDAAADWYETHSGLGAKFVAAVRESLNRIGAMPELHAVVLQDVRRAVLRGFPYNIYYRVRADRVEVIAVFHGRRNPSEWQTRV
jgi:plasmid stabilization system protein ParE